MFYFEGNSCVCCGEKFTANDDVVTCPVCGSPHHRSCYNEKGECANEYRHGDYSWERADDFDGMIECSRCGAENNPGRLYCCSCGSALGGNEAGVGTGEKQGIEYRIHEIPLKDFSSYIGTSGPIYAPMFHQMHVTNRKVSFNIIGLFFPSFWYLNHKMYIHGLLIILFNLVSNFFTMFFYDDIQRIYTVAANFDAVGLQKVMAEAPVPFYGSLIFGLLSYAIAILTALFSNRIYMNWCIRHIREIRRKWLDDEHYQSELEQHGRSNFGLVLVIILVYFIATMLIGRLF